MKQTNQGDDLSIRRKAGIRKSIWLCGIGLSLLVITTTFIAGAWRPESTTVQTVSALGIESVSPSPSSERAGATVATTVPRAPAERVRQALKNFLAAQTFRGVVTTQSRTGEFQHYSLEWVRPTSAHLVNGTQEWIVIGATGYYRTSGETWRRVTVSDDLRQFLDDLALADVTTPDKAVVQFVSTNQPHDALQPLNTYRVMTEATSFDVLIGGEDWQLHAIERMHQDLTVRVTYSDVNRPVDITLPEP